MIRSVVSCVLLALASSAQADDIVGVLRSSHEVRLARFAASAPDATRAAILQRSFERMRRAMPGQPAVELRVVRSGTLAETMLGRIVVANESLADLPEGERLFILAHELGHCVEHHWDQLGALYLRWIPGEVVPAKTDAVANALGREASALAHQHELDADAFALRLLAQLGEDPAAALSVFARQGVAMQTATHPGTRHRVSALRLQLASMSH